MSILKDDSIGIFPKRHILDPNDVFVIVMLYLDLETPKQPTTTNKTKQTNNNNNNNSNNNKQQKTTITTKHTHTHQKINILQKPQCNYDITFSMFAPTR